MSRHKSPERIQADRDKAIRKERREQKRQERETKRKARSDKQGAVFDYISKHGEVEYPETFYKF